MSFNHTEKLLACIRSLREQSCVAEILILDNRSTNDMTQTYAQAEAMGSEAVPVRVTYADHKMSFSEAQNWGIDRSRHDFVLLMGDDAFILSPETLGSSVQLLEDNPSVGIVGHKILNLDGTLNHCGVYVHWYNGSLIHFGRDRNPSDSRYSLTYSCVAVTGACLLLRRTAIRFDPMYWFEYEDVDFCFQYLLAGYRILCNPECLVVHEESSGRKLIQDVDPLWLGKRTIGGVHFWEKWKPFMGRFKAKCILMNLIETPQSFLFRTYADYVAMLVCLLIFVSVQPISWRALGYGLGVFLLVLLGYFGVRTLVFGLFALGLRGYIFFKGRMGKVTG